MDANRGSHLLVFEHLNGVVPAHASVGSTTSDQNDFGLAFLGKHQAAGAIGACGSSTVESESGGSASGERKHGDGRSGGDEIYKRR